MAAYVRFISDNYYTRKKGWLQNHKITNLFVNTSNKINAQVTLQNKYLKKIRADYKTVIDTFIDHVGSITEDKITKYIGGAANIDLF